VDSPRVSLLLSQKDDARASAFMMPSLVGLSTAAATSRAASLGLYVILGAAPSASTSTNPDGTPQTTPSAPAESGGIVVSHSPASGHRVVRGEGVKLNFGGGQSGS
jgi:beta-lactam-binding protein with PASTA domain